MTIYSTYMGLVSWAWGLYLVLGFPNLITFNPLLFGCGLLCCVRGYLSVVSPIIMLVTRCHWLSNSCWHVGRGVLLLDLLVHLSSCIVLRIIQVRKTKNTRYSQISKINSSITSFIIVSLLFDTSKGHEKSFCEPHGGG